MDRRVVHVSCGNEKWEPTIAEMEQLGRYVCHAFNVGGQDDVAVITTRDGVTINILQGEGIEIDSFRARDPHQVELIVISQKEKESPEKQQVYSEAQIKHMVNRFLGWQLPENFNPDGGISFEKIGNVGTPHEYARYPTGTNVFDAEQATAMVRYMLEGLPIESPEKQGDSDEFQA